MKRSTLQVLLLVGVAWLVLRPKRDTRPMYGPTADERPLYGPGY